MQVKLKEIIARFLDSSDSSSHDFTSCWNRCMWGMKTEFGLDVVGAIKTVLLTVNANKTAQLPCDYISYSKVGVINQHGEVVTFKRNDQLSNYHQEYYNSTNRTLGVPTFDGFVTGVTDNGIDDINSQLYLNYRNNGGYYNLYGIGSGTINIGEYKLDEAAQIILFDPNFTYSQVLLEYLSNGIDETDFETAIDIRAGEAMMSYLRWQNTIDKPKKYGAGMINKLRLDFYNEKRKARMRLNKFILNEIQNAERRSWKMVAKA